MDASRYNAYVDGWISRQLKLNNNSRLDLLGYKNFYGRKIMVLVELKSRPLECKDILQVGKYEVYLQQTIEDIGLLCLKILPILVGVNTKADRKLWESANTINAGLFNIQLTDGLINLKPVPFLDFKYKETAKSIFHTGRYDSLIQFLLPEMPDFVQEEYKFYEC